MPKPSNENSVRTQKVLFICTGNYYRSRFAEAFFNYSVDQRKRGDPLRRWRAFSRGLEISRLSSKQNQVPVSIYTTQELSRLKIPLSYVDGQPTQFQPQDLDQADSIVALSESEHRPLFKELFPRVSLDRVSFWTVEDLHLTQFSSALDAIRVQVTQLLEKLARSRFD